MGGHSHCFAGDCIVIAFILALCQTLPSPVENLRGSEPLLTMAAGGIALSLVILIPARLPGVLHKSAGVHNSALAPALLVGTPCLMPATFLRSVRWIPL